MWHNDVSYLNVQKFCPHSSRRPWPPRFTVLLFRPLRKRGVSFLSLLSLWGALGTYHIYCIRHKQSSLGISALLLCRQGYGTRGVIQQWHFFLLAPFYNLRRFIKHDNILRNMNFNNHLNETNVAISLRVSITNHLKLVRIYQRNPVYRIIHLYVRFQVLKPYSLLVQ